MTVIRAPPPLISFFFLHFWVSFVLLDSLLVAFRHMHHYD
uniref:Uncharacterized protein n=1 Tax=Rhizophora mucronata TaxID=61149 RepID=A0A2P2NXV1_RHIMU